MEGAVCCGYTTWYYKVAILALKNGLPSQKNNIYGPKLDIEGAEKNDSEIRRLAVSLSSPPPSPPPSPLPELIQDIYPVLHIFFHFMLPAPQAL
jgi:hypothetical protein